MPGIHAADKYGINHPIAPLGESESDNAVYTTSNGVKWPHPYEAQRVGQTGPLLLQDFHLVDLLSHFDRERIPERVVHAKGAGAHGTFVCTKSLGDLCQASIFSNEGEECPITARFSTVGGESGSADTARDPRGFSVKMKTQEGNMDWVFNNTPVFFLRDPAKFPHFIHTQKRDPQTHLTGAQDSTHFWHYLSENPESIHQVMILMGDRGIPDGYRKMHGYSGHTFKLVNKDSEWVYAQIHLISDQGTAFLTQEKAGELAGSAPDYATEDLFNAIDEGDFPSWTCHVQTMTPKQAEEYKINVFDLTKVWSHKDFPLREFGKMTLNRNVLNYFAEVEQAAFNPAHLVTGVEPSADPVLQSRLFSYPDTHRHRIGVNYQQLPVNQNLVSNAGNFQRDGSMAFYNQGRRPPYLSSIMPIEIKERSFDLSKVHNDFVGSAVAMLSELQPIDFEQPRALFRDVIDDDSRKRTIGNISGHISKCKDPKTVKKMLAIFNEVDPELASGIAKEIGVSDYPKTLKGMFFAGCRNGPDGYQPDVKVNKLGYTNGSGNGHPADSENSKSDVTNGV